MDSGGINASVVATSVWSATTRSLTVGGGALVGSTLQAPAVASGISLTATGTTNAVNFAGPAAGTFLQVGWACSATSTGTQLTAQIEIVIDGGATFVIQIFNAGLTFTATALAVAMLVNGTGTNNGNSLTFQIPISFTTSLRVGLNVTATNLTVGTATLTVLWGHS